MPGYLTHAMVLISMEAWLEQLEVELKRKRSRVSAAGLSWMEARFLELAEKARSYLRPGTTAPGREFPLTEIKDPRKRTGAHGVGHGLSQYAFSGTLGPDFPEAGNILALHQRWVGKTMHLGAPRRAWTDAGSTRFAFHFIDTINAEFPQPERKRPMMSYVIGHLSNVACDVLVYPFMNQWVWTQGEIDDRHMLRQQFGASIDTRVSYGFFQREDIKSGQDWADYYVDTGDYKDEIKRLMEVYFECFKRTYQVTEPSESLCGPSASKCTYAKLDAPFLVDGYRNTVNWAIDVGYDQTPWVPKLLWSIGIFGASMYLVYSIWSSTEDFSPIVSEILDVKEEDVAVVKGEIIAEWNEKGLGSERIWYRMIDGSYTVGGMLFTAFNFLLGGVPVVWPDGMFGEGKSPPGWTKVYGFIKFPVLFILDKILEGTVVKEWESPAARWLKFFLKSLGPDIFDVLYTNKRSEENGKEGDILAQVTFWPKIALSSGYLLSSVLVFGVKSKPKDDGTRENTATGTDYALGLIMPFITTLFVIFSDWFDKSIVEGAAGARWPDNDPFPALPFLQAAETDGVNHFTVDFVQKSPIRLFPNTALTAVETRKRFPEAPSETSYSERAKEDERARKEGSTEHGDYLLSTIFDRAAQLSGLMAIAALNYDAVTAAEKESAKTIFKDWNLDYRTIDEWQYLMRDEEGQAPGLVIAGRKWLSDLRADRSSSRPVISRMLEVLGRVTIGLKLRGKVLDRHPFNASVAEPLPGIGIHGGQNKAQTNAAGEYELEGAFLFGEQDVEVKRAGIETVVLKVNVTRTDAGANIVIQDPLTRTEYARTDHAGTVDVSTTIQVNVADVKVVVHKLRGRVFWPDSRVVNNANYLGTPLAGKKVYAVPLASGDIGPQRPSNTLALSALKNTPGVVQSTRPGRPAQNERTDADGAFEIKFIDLSVDRRHLIWVESLDPDTAAESPEYTARTVFANLLELSGSAANLVATVGRHVIDHTYSLTSDAVKWGVESIKVVNFPLDGGRSELRALRPARDAKQNYDQQPLAGERLTFDIDKKIISDYRIHSLSLVPVFEPVDAQSDQARDAQSALHQAMDNFFPRGHFASEVRFVLDARRISRGIDLSVGAWDGAWNAANVDASQQRRRCELLEKTFVVSPQIPNANLQVGDIRWRVDAVTLADYSLISIPNPPPLNRAVVANRTLDSDWVPILKPVAPRVTGLSAGRHLFLAPGHGFFDANPPSNALANWRSQRGGYNFRAGEDENDAYMASEVNRVAQRQGMQVTNVREVQDFTAPGVVHPANNTFNPSTDRDFLRLWQQNPLYFLGSQGNAVIVGPVANIGQLAGDHNDKGIEARWRLAEAVAGGANPIDIFLAIHTNAANGAARGVSSIYLDVDVAEGNNAEANVLGQEFAGQLNRALAADCHLNQRPVVSVRQLGNPIADLQRTFDHWTQAGAGTSALWPRVQAAPANPAGWQQRQFPRAIPASLVEVAFHDNAEDAALLTRAWFRRRAGESMSFAVEGQLRANANPISRADLVRMLRANFGPTARIQGLAADNGAVVANTIRDHVQTATGEVVAVGAADLGAAVTAIEGARNRFTRQSFVDALGNAFADVAGYPAGSPEINQFVTPAILGDRNLARPNVPVTRVEAGSFIASALAWSPGNLDTVVNRRIGGNSLLARLDGADHPDKFLPNIEVQDLRGRIQVIDPLEIYRVVALYLADEHFTRLSQDPAQPRQYIVRAGDRITVVADMQGVPWLVNVNNDVQFTISSLGEFKHDLRGNNRTRKQLGSEVWALDLPTPGGYQLSIAVKHRTRADKTLRHETPVDISVLAVAEAA